MAFGWLQNFPLCWGACVMQAGELPACMLPDHNDGYGAASDLEEDEAGGGKGGPGAKGQPRGKKAGGGAAAKRAALEALLGVAMPFRPNKHITGGCCYTARCCWDMAFFYSFRCRKLPARFESPSGPCRIPPCFC
jgi:hypothetical protein